MNSVHETPIQAKSRTLPPPGRPSSGARLPSPASSNDNEQVELYEDKVDQTYLYRYAPNSNANQEEMQLLDDGTPGITESFEHEVVTAPLFTRDAKFPAGFCQHKSQYGLLGSLIGIRCVRSSTKRGTNVDHRPFRDKTRTEVQADPRLYVNTVRSGVQSNYSQPSNLNSAECTILCNCLRGPGFREIAHRLGVVGEHADPAL